MNEVQKEKGRRRGSDEARGEGARKLVKEVCRKELA